MLWFNNHSSDQEKFYMEAREALREQRRQQRQSSQDSDTVVGSAIGFVALVATIVIVFNLSGDLLLALGLGFVALFLACGIYGIIEDRPKKSVQHHEAKSQKEEEYTDDTF